MQIYTERFGQMKIFLKDVAQFRIYHACIAHLTADLTYRGCLESGIRGGKFGIIFAGIRYGGKLVLGISKPSNLLRSLVRLILQPKRTMASVI